MFQETRIAFLGGVTVGIPLLHPASLLTRTSTEETS